MSTTFRMNPVPTPPSPRTYTYRAEMVSTPDIDGVSFECNLSFPQPFSSQTDNALYTDRCHSHIEVICKSVIKTLQIITPNKWRLNQSATSHMRCGTS